MKKLGERLRCYNLFRRCQFRTVGVSEKETEVRGDAIHHSVMHNNTDTIIILVTAS